ncbi:MAG: restriction endonuclease subunit S [Chitinophagaceae bacterium]|nr:restriction endonuclease subunit S [Chitinophagaceae bacterium]
MKSNYKQLGEFIEEVNIRNTDLSITKLVGVSMEKTFISSVANLVGTDMSVYKVLNKGQLACKLMSVGRDEKLPVDLYREEEPAIVSSAYYVFQPKDEKVILPEYLFMWLCRPENDRYIGFISGGDVRGGISWETFCETPIKVPSLIKQKEIAKEYNTIVNRITLINQLIQKLEETTQALYKNWFVDFEFPNKEGKPYKSSGGEMLGSELGEIPKDWKAEKLNEFVVLSQGLVMNATTNHLLKEKGIPLLRITDLINDTQKIFIDESVPVKNIAKKEDIIYTRTGQVGFVFRNKEGVVYNNCFKVTPKNELLLKDYIFWFLRQSSTYNLMVELAAGSAQSDLSHSAFYSVFIIAPSIPIQENFSIKIKPIENLIFSKRKEVLVLEKMKNLLLSKLATIEN